MSTPKDLEFYLTPSPGATPEFLATVKPIDQGPDTLQIWDKLCSKLGPDQKVVFENYTRDGWSWKPQKPGICYTVPVISTDGRNKVPGFAKYLKERQKSAYGRIGSSTFVVVVSYVQSTKSNDPNQIDCRFYPDMNNIPNCSLRTRQEQQQQGKQYLQSAPTQQQNTVKPSSSSTSTGAVGVAPVKKSGLLGMLVGAQQRTNMHVAVSNAKTQPRHIALTAPQKQQQVQQNQSGIAVPSTSSSSEVQKYNDNDGDETDGLRTAQEVFAEFRQFCQDQMLDFDMAEEQILKIPISLSEYTADLLDEEKSKVTMELLKYMIYEAAEEVNEEWIPYKEPSEYMDEAVIVIYKEGAAPPEVLEDLNKGELPEEVIGQQRAIAESRQRQAAQAELRKKQEAEQLVHNRKKQKRPHEGNEDHGDEDDDDDAALNQNKRDRRTMEAYQRDKERGRAK